MEELTKYEYARIIGARALQLAYGAPPMVKIVNQSDSFIAVAEQEFNKKVIPLSVVE